jgi:NSS family neurotransmitter:Na+ symporter
VEERALSNQIQERGVWSSKVGFIMAAAGSAVGLGNIWRFPYMTGMHGGAAFVLVYLGFVFLLGLPIMLNELIIGRRTNRNPVGALNLLSQGTQWKLVGGLGVLTGFGILSFYSVIAGWTLGYIFKSIEWGWGTPIPQDQLAQVFEEFTTSPVHSIGFLLIFMLLTMAVVYGGVKHGIERWSKILMPILFGLLILLIIRAVTLPGAEAGIKFYLQPDFSKINGKILIEALGQAFFSMSLGMGAMITYGSYLSGTDNLVTSGLSVCLFDTLVALLAGMAILPAVFALGQEPAQGPNLIFVVLPAIFMKMPAGAILGPLFFFLLAIAALTSTVSLLEVVTSYFVDEKGWHRHKAVVIIGIVCAGFSVLAALSWGISEGLSKLPIIKMSFFDIMDILFAKYSLTIGALLLAIFSGWNWGIRVAAEEVTAGNSSFSGKILFRVSKTKVVATASIWGFVIRFLAPVFIVILIVDSLNLQENFLLIHGVIDFIFLEGFILWLCAQKFAGVQTTLGKSILLPIARTLMLVILAPVLLLIPVVGWILAILLAIGIYYILLNLILEMPGNKIFIPLSVITIIELGVLGWYYFL